MAKLEAGDPAAIYEVTSVIVGFLNRYRAYDLRDQWDDICQEVLVALIEAVRADRIRAAGAFVNYTGATTRYKLREWIRKKHKPGSPDHAGDPEQATRSDPALLERRRADDPDLRFDMERALETLPERERNVIELIYLRGHSYKEASDRLDMPLGTLKRLQTSGLRELRRAMGMSR